MVKRSIRKNKNSTLYLTYLTEDQLQLTAAVTNPQSHPVESCREIYEDIARLVNDLNMTIVHDRLFGNIIFYNDLLNARTAGLRQAARDAELPHTFIEGEPFNGKGFAGVQIRAFRPQNEDKDVWTINDNSGPRGRAWKRNGATFIMLQNVNASVAGFSLNGRMTQTANMFEHANSLLQKEGAHFKNVVRTWIYLSDILDWYGDFNKARNTKFNEFNLLQNEESEPAERIYLPASTGIRGNNPFGACGTMDVLAVLPNENVIIEQTTGVQQKSPYRYGSAFSRGMNIREKDVTHIFLSGTAAIDEKGQSLYLGDTRAQIRKTMDVAAALVEQEGATLQDICDATVFLKNAADQEIFYEVMREYGLEEMPAICVVADVCRAELLFELDAEFAIAK
ncbi:MAG TPA: RidA family protein [bacterium]|nr:RidA family protein [bacterium]HPN45945.1 RidA family protein [bacterium]